MIVATVRIVIKLSEANFLIEDYLITAYYDLVKKVKATKQRQIHYCEFCKCLEICKEENCDFRSDFFQRHGYCLEKMRGIEVKRLMKNDWNWNINNVLEFILNVFK